MTDMTVIDASPAERADIRGFEKAMNDNPSEGIRYGCLRSPDGKDIPVPEPLYRVLVESARALIAGYQVIVAPVHHRLTTQEAADLLNVSRPYLVKLLDRGEIQHEKVGRHRRVAFGNVMEYKKKRLAERQEALTNLIRESEEAGLYERTETD